MRSAARVERYGEMVVRAFELAMGFQFDVAFTDDAEDFAMIVLHKDAMLLTGKNKQKEAQGGSANCCWRRMKCISRLHASERIREE